MPVKCGPVDQMSFADTTASPRAVVVAETPFQDDPVQWANPRAPAAQTFVAETAATAFSGPSLGEAECAQVDPFQCSIRLWLVPPVPLTETRVFVSPAPLGTGASIVVQAVPSQWTVVASAPAPSPTAHTSVGAIAVM